MARSSPRLPELVSLTGAGRILGMTKAGVQKMAARGELVGARLDGDGNWAFVKAYVEDYARALGKFSD